MLFTYLALALVALILMRLKESEWIFLESLYSWRSLLSFVVDALGAAVLEELIFRKYLLRYFLKKTNQSKAVILSALIFSGLHYPTVGAVFFSGIFYAIVCLRYNSLLFAIAVHTFYDFLGNMARSVEKTSHNFENGLTPYQVLHGGDVISHFAFMILYFSAILLLNFIAKLKEGKVERVA
jgi:membrane protease YdiL (CAAX protease family)